MSQSPEELITSTLFTVYGMPAKNDAQVIPHSEDGKKKSQIIYKLFRCDCTALGLPAD